MTSTAPDTIANAPRASQSAMAGDGVAPELCAKMDRFGGWSDECRLTPHTANDSADATCPAAAIGKQIAAVSDRLEEMNELAIRNDSAILQRDIDHLRALRAHLLADVEWVTPTSLDGLMVVAFTIRETFEGFVVRAGERIEFDDTEDERRFTRIMQRLIEGISRLAGHAPSAIGLGDFWPDVCAAAPDRSALATCATCQLNPREKQPA